MSSNCPHSICLYIFIASISFGAKGQGKTTALWGSAALGPEHAIIPRTIGELFAAIERVKDKDDQVGVAVSFLRVSATGEMLNDCLVEDIEASGLGLRLREVPLQHVPLLPLRNILLFSLVTTGYSPHPPFRVLPRGPATTSGEFGGGAQRSSFRWIGPSRDD